MKSVAISLVRAGSLKYPVNIPLLEKWPSKIFNITHRSTIDALPKARGRDWTYSDEEFRSLIKADPQADFTVALVSVPLEGNYYMRRIGANVGVLSLHEMADIVGAHNFSIEHFIVRNFYELAVLYKASKQLATEDPHSWVHDDVRGCLFDMNANKLDIIFSMHMPKLCEQCRSKVMSRQIDSQLLRVPEKELSALKKPRYHRIRDWIERNPLMTLLLTAISGIALNIIASYVFEYLRSLK